MKKLNFIKPVIVFLFLSFSYLSHAQSELYGSWTAGCTLEKMNRSSISTCGLCPTEPVSASSMNINFFEININPQTIKIGDSEPVSYKWDKEINGISFSHNKSEYNFKVLIGGGFNLLIWKEQTSGTIVVLQLNKK